MICPKCECDNLQQVDNSLAYYCSSCSFKCTNEFWRGFTYAKDQNKEPEQSVWKVELDKTNMELASAITKNDNLWERTRSAERIIEGMEKEMHSLLKDIDKLKDKNGHFKTIIRLMVTQL